MDSILVGVATEPEICLWWCEVAVGSLWSGFGLVFVFEILFLVGLEVLLGGGALLRPFWERDWMETPQRVYWAITKAVAFGCFGRKASEELEGKPGMAKNWFFAIFLL